MLIISMRILCICDAKSCVNCCKQTTTISTHQTMKVTTHTWGTWLQFGKTFAWVCINAIKKRHLYATMTGQQNNGALIIDYHLNIWRSFINNGQNIRSPDTLLPFALPFPQWVELHDSAFVLLCFLCSVWCLSFAFNEFFSPKKKKKNCMAFTIDVGPNII